MHPLPYKFPCEYFLSVSAIMCMVYWQCVTVLRWGHLSLSLFDCNLALLNTSFLSLSILYLWSWSLLITSMLLPAPVTLTFLYLINHWALSYWFVRYSDSICLEYVLSIHFQCMFFFKYSLCFEDNNYIISCFPFLPPNLPMCALLSFKFIRFFP